MKNDYDIDELMEMNIPFRIDIMNELFNDSMNMVLDGRIAV